MGLKLGMKEIDYIFQNLNTKGFLDKLKEWSGEQAHPGYLVLENVKNSNDEISYLLDHLIYKGIFFQKVKDLSLIYHGYSWFKDGGPTTAYDNNDYASISCFFSKTDNKYWLLFYSYGERYFFEVDTYENKPSIQKIKDVLEKKYLFSVKPDHNLTLRNFEDDTMIDLSDQEKEEFKDQINLEREDK